MLPVRIWLRDGLLRYTLIELVAAFETPFQTKFIDLWNLCRDWHMNSNTNEQSIHLMACQKLQGSKE